MSVIAAADQAGAAPWSASLDPYRDDLRMMLYDLIEEGHPDRHALVRDRLLGLHRTLDRAEVRVVFGGHFSCGKSTLLNALLGRDLLPAGDYPETGVPCSIRSGPYDDVLADGADGPVRLPVTTEAIAWYVSLTGSDGAYRRQVAGVNRLDVTLTGTGLGPDVAWVDCPGIDDKPEATERARAEAATADILVWVFDSRQPMSETDLAFIDEHAATHGQESILFVLNAFLPADTGRAWDRFLNRNLPQLMDKLEGRLGEVDVVTASARAIGRHPTGFGGAELRELLYDVTGVTHPAVAASRLSRVVQGLDELIGIVGGWVEAEDTARAEEAAREQESLDKFTRSLERRIGIAFIEHTVAAQACLAPVLITVDVNLRRDGWYAGELRSGLERVTTALGDELIERVGKLAVAKGRSGLTDTTRRELRAALRPGPVGIVVPDNEVSAQGPGAGAAAGAVAGLVFGPIGSLIGAGIGGLVGAGKSAADAMAQDRAGAKESITAAHTRAISHLTAARVTVTELILGEYRPPPAEELPPSASCALLDALIERRDALSEQELP